mmetsp:Transcript_20086/g.59650  ORF Transcript_20086/g.59650 Transcript_20086/m.59650 type:complete len:259 (-) Transcript_20086:1072-1848(-)|eukprot:353716-Chlamydomonas_euryale.AAC.9
MSLSIVTCSACGSLAGNVRLHAVAAVRGRVQAFSIGLGLSRSELDVQRSSSPDPHKHDDHEDGTQVWRGGSQGAKADDHELLDESTAGFAERIADDVNGSLALNLDLIIQRDVCHLLAGIEQGILGTLGKDVLGSAHQHGGVQRGQAPAGQRRGQNVRAQHQSKEDQTSHQQHGWGDQRGHTPAEAGKDLLSQNHHRECDNASGSGEVAHERRVLVRVGELGLELRLPGDLHQVDGDSVRNYQRGQVTDVRRRSQEGE